MEGKKPDRIHTFMFNIYKNIFIKKSQRSTVRYFKYLLPQAFTLADMTETGNVEFARKKRTS